MMKKIKARLYSHREYFLLPLPNNEDWVAIKDWKDSNRVLHGNNPLSEVFYIHNTLRDLRRFIDRCEPDGVVRKRTDSNAANPATEKPQPPAARRA